MERTRISRIASSNGQSSDGNRVALVYNAIPIDDRRWKTTFICKVSRIHTFICICILYILLCAESTDLLRSLNGGLKLISFYIL